MIRSTLRLMATGLLASALAPSTASAQSWVLTYEAPGAGATTSTLASGGVEDFNARSPASWSFSSNFGGSSINGSYVSVDLANALPFGFGGSRHVEASSETFSLTLDRSVNYFGYYLAAANPGNLVTFYRGAQKVGSFDVGSIAFASFGSQTAYVQPVPNFNWPQPYVFINFHLTGAGQTFDRIEFSDHTHESDNHTIGNYLTIGGVGVVPEPGSIALMLAGLAGIGFAARRRRG